MKTVMTKLKTSLTNNFGIKAIAFIVATIVWLAVVNVNDPDKTITIYNIPITMTHEDAITNLGMVYSLESKDNINVTITGKRSVVGNLSADDFVAKASLAELSKVNAIPIEVTAKKSSVARKITIVKQSLNTAKISLENIETQIFDIEVEFKGSTSKGYVVGSYSLSKNRTSVKAPESVLDKISKVVAVCNLEAASEDFEKKCNVVLYDKRGNIIKSDKISLSVKNVTAYVDILKEKEIPLNVAYLGMPADGYMVSDVILSMDTVKIVGTDENLNQVEALNINDIINISRRKQDLIMNIDLKEYLPEGVWISGESELEVTVKIDKLDSREFMIDADSIEIKNLSKELTADITDKEVKVSFRGEKTVLDSITSDSIKASVDLKGKKEGTSKIDIEIEPIEGAQLINQANIKIKIKTKE